MIDWNLVFETLPTLWVPAMTSLFIAALSATLGITGGMLLAMMQSSKWFFLRAVAISYVQFIRGTPLLMQLLFFFYVCPQLGLLLSPISSSILAMGCNSSAYLSQVFRVGIESLDPVALQAAKGLGMNRWQVIIHLILPQTWRAIMPSLSNEATTLLKDSSLASVVGVVELTKAGAIIRSRTFDAFSSLLAVCFVYLLLTLLLQLLFNYAEKRGELPCCK